MATQESMTLGVLVDWCRVGGLDAHRIEIALDQTSPKTSLVNACLDVPHLREFRKTQG